MGHEHWIFILVRRTQPTWTNNNSSLEPYFLRLEALSNEREQVRHAGTHFYRTWNFKRQHSATVWIKFYIHGSVHRDFVLIRSNKMQQYAGIYLLQNHSTRFGRPSRPSSWVQKTVTAASGTGHSNGAKTFLQCGLLRPRWRKVVAPLLWPVPEAAVKNFCTPDDGRDGRPKHVEYTCSK